MPLNRCATWLVSTAVCTTLAACAYGPVPDDPSLATAAQPVVHRVADWNGAASVAVTALLSTLAQAGVPRTTPVYLHAPAPTTLFDHGMHELLTTQLVQNGVPVRMQPEPAGLEISYHTDLIPRHASAYQELMLSTSAHQRGQYLARQTQLFYVADFDHAWFTPALNGPLYPNTTFQVVGP